MKYDEKNLLPDNFDICRYHEVANFTAIDWWFAIRMRQDFLMAVESISVFLDRKLGHQEEYEVLNMAFFNLFGDPLNSNFFINLKGDVIRIFDKNEHTIDEFGLAVNYFPDEMVIPVDHFPKYILEHPNKILDDDFLIVRTPEFSHQAELPITINIGYSDKLIWEHLKYLLRDLREKYGYRSVRGLGTRSLLDWGSYKLLAYMDLKAWELFTKIKITNSRFCEILCLHSKYDEETIRKTIEPLRLELLKELPYADGGEDEVGLAKINQLKNLAYLEFKKLQGQGK